MEGSGSGRNAAFFKGIMGKHFVLPSGSKRLNHRLKEAWDGDTSVLSQSSAFPSLSPGAGPEPWRGPSLSSNLKDIYRQEPQTILSQDSAGFDSGFPCLLFTTRTHRGDPTMVDT